MRVKLPSKREALTKPRETYKQKLTCCQLAGMGFSSRTTCNIQDGFVMILFELETKVLRTPANNNFGWKSAEMQ